MRRWAAVALVEATAVLLAGGVAVALAVLDTNGPTLPDPAQPAQTPEAIDLPGQPSATAPVIVPGRPGESAQVLRPGQLTPRAGARHNAADVQFVRMMIPHHEQALRLAALVPARAGSTQVIALGERIRSGQQPEIQVLTAWLRDRGLDREATGSHDHGTMPGMQSTQAIGALTAQTGTGFDRMFVEMMSEHHRGAIEMAQRALATGQDERVRELARNIAFEQAVEIDRMREILAGQPR